MRHDITDRRRRPTQDRARRTVARILDAAIVLFERHGYTATTMSAIAEAAGVGPASLYQWFPTKDDVLLGLAERHLLVAARELDAVAAALREEMPPLASTMRRFVEVVVEINADDARFHRELFDRCPRTPPIAALLAGLQQAVVDELVWHMRRLRLGGGDVRLRAEVVVHAVDAVVHEVVIARPEGPERDDAVDEAVRLAVSTLHASERQPLE